MIGIALAALIPSTAQRNMPYRELVWLAFLINYVLFALNTPAPTSGQSQTVGLYLPLIAVYLTFDLWWMLLLLGVGSVLALALQLQIALEHHPRPMRQALRELLGNTSREMIPVTGGMLAGVVVYVAMGGLRPLTLVSTASLPPLLGMLITTLVMRVVLTTLWTGGQFAATGPATPSRDNQLYYLFLDGVLTLPSILVAHEYYRGNPIDLGVILVVLMLVTVGLRITMVSRARTDRQLRELSLLNHTDRLLAAAPDRSTLAELVLDHVGQLLDAPVAVFGLADIPRQRLHFPLVKRGGRPEQWPDQPLSGTLFGHVILTGQSLCLPADAAGERESVLPERPPEVKDGALLAVPIQFQHESYGLLLVQHPDNPTAYTAWEKHLLESLATQTGVALHNLTLREEAEHFTDGLMTVNQLSGNINASLELDQILRQVCSASRELSHASRVAGFIQQRPGQPYNMAHMFNVPSEIEAPLRQSVISDRPKWNVLLTQARGMRIRDVTADPRVDWLAELLEPLGVRGVTIVPIISVRSIMTERTLSPMRDVIGFQLVMFDVPHTPTEYESQLLLMIANQTAVALENTALFEETQDNVRRLAYLAETARLFTESLSLDTVAQSVVQWTVEVLGFDTATLALKRQDAEALDIQAHAVEQGLPYIAAPAIHHTLEDMPEITEVLRHRWSQIFTANDPDLSPMLQEIFSRSGLQRMVFTPLHGHTGALGMLVLGKISEEAIQGPDVELAESIASQVSIAIENARYYEFTERELTARVREINVLEQVLQAISVSTDEEMIIQSVLAAAHEVTGADLMGCGLVIPDGSLHMYWQFAESDVLHQRLYPDIQRGIIGETIRSRQPIVVGNTRQNPQYWTPEGSEPYLSELCVPILHQDEILGVLNLESKRLNNFTQAHIRFMQSLAGHAAVAISRARLFQSNQRQITILDKIRVLSLDLLQADDLEGVLQEVCSAALDLVQALNIHIYFYNRETDELTFAASLWNDGRRNFEVAKPRPNGLTYQAIRSGVPILSDDFERVPGVPTRRLGIFPLIYRGQTVGSLNAAVGDPLQMGESEIRALELLTNQAASAIERVRLFESRKRQIELLEALRRNSVALLNTANMDHLLSIVCQMAQVMVNAESVHVYFYDQDADRLAFAASLWATGERNVEANVPRQEGITYRTARTGVPQQLTREDLAHNHVGREVELIQGIPLKHQDKVVGVLNVAVKQAAQIGPDELRALELMANQAAAAILSVRLLEEIRESRDQMQAILNTVRDGLMLVDRNGYLLRTNPAAELLLDLDLRGHLGKHVMRIVRKAYRGGLPPDDFRHPAQVRTIWKELRDDPYRYTTRQIELHKNGEVLYLEEESAPVLSENNEIVGRLFVWHDITERHELEKARENLTNTIVHDLRSPLTSIKGGLSIIAEMIFDPEPDTDTILEVIRVSETSADRLLDLVNSLLDVARLESGDMPLTLVTTDLDSIIRDAAETLRVALDENKIRLVLNLPESLPTGFMDSEKIRRVIINLLDNAIHYTPGGGVIAIRANYDQDQHQFCVTVDDSGPGVPPELRNRVFEKFATGLTQPPTPKHRGLGLGLSFCKLAVEAHGGKIWVDEGENGGAAFRFTLPLTPDSL
ncbi:MAG: hypothetical protein Kow0077_19700 [Anaerolineae bacterium]